jgi:hypothetical protein
MTSANTSPLLAFFVEGMLLQVYRFVFLLSHYLVLKTFFMYFLNPT